ncbi:SRPBCC family protein [Solimonas terrae]|uniref:SRPBCC family protein n=1 Tax=Solimonas terrae TaxID=1396819 RepID=A0A6M2BU83_9GAMM|nr:SRPBCC family protein [Solimonas terrae]NGY05805.1 SRPBCC family protein [Solimonas terrae]
MAQREVHFHEQINAPIDRVFEFLADHQNFAALFGGRCTRIKPGDDAAEPNGVGSVRRIGPGPLAFDETIVVFDRPQRIDYTISRGSPLKNHLGSIRLRNTGAGTEIDYVIRAEGRLPGLGALAGHALALAWKANARKQFAKIEA